jgi:hypothetical protein
MKIYIRTGTVYNVYNMIHLIKFNINTKDASIYEAFNKAMKGFYSMTSPTTKGEDLFFIDKMLYNWVSIMCDRRHTCEMTLKEGSWDECYFTSKFAGFEISAMIIFT